MKKFIILFLSVIFITACSTNDDMPNYHFESVGITEVDAPAEFIYGNTYEITLTYELPNECHNLYDIDYIYQDTSRIVTAITIVNDDATCIEEPTTQQQTINVHVGQLETYTFKFWQGQNEQGEDQYLIIDIPVN